MLLVLFSSLKRMNFEYTTVLECIIGIPAPYFCSIEVYRLKQIPVSLELERKAMYM